MAMSTALHCMSDTTPKHDTQTVEGSANLSAPVKPSSCEPMSMTRCLFGDDSLMTVSTCEQVKSRTESTVPSSATKGDTDRQTLSDKLTPLLMSSGLIKGITPTSMRRRLGLRTLDFALSKPDGNDAE